MKPVLTIYYSSSGETCWQQARLALSQGSKSTPLTRWSLLISPPVDRPAIVSWSAPSGIISVCHRIIISIVLIISWYPDYILIIPAPVSAPQLNFDFLHASPIFDQSESAQHEIQITFSFAKRWLHSSSCQSASNGRGNKNIFFCAKSSRII